MFALLSPRLWILAAIVAALAFSHFTVYRKGRADVQAQWTLATAQANIEARQMEQRRQRNVDDAAKVAVASQARIVADARHARSERDGLRGDLIAIRAHASQSLAAATFTVSALSAVLESCSREYQELAEIADRHAADSLMYQSAWPK